MNNCAVNLISGPAAERGTCLAERGLCKPGLYLLTLLFCSCSSTTLYYPNGNRQLVIQGDSQSLQFQDGRLTAIGLNHSNPTKASANGIVSGVTALGAAAAGLR